MTMSIDREALQQAIAEVLRDQADEVAAMVIERIADDAPDHAQGPVEEYARVRTVEGDNGPAILADCPVCEVKLFRAECFYDDYLDSQHIWDSSQHAQLLAADHDANQHPST